MVSSMGSTVNNSRRAATFNRFCAVPEKNAPFYSSSAVIPVVWSAIPCCSYVSYNEIAP
jgi:hypothetical protein